MRTVTDASKEGLFDFLKRTSLREDAKQTLMQVSLYHLNWDNLARFCEGYDVGYWNAVLDMEAVLKQLLEGER